MEFHGEFVDAFLDCLPGAVLLIQQRFFGRPGKAERESIRLRRRDVLN